MGGRTMPMYCPVHPNVVIDYGDFGPECELHDDTVDTCTNCTPAPCEHCAVDDWKRAAWHADANAKAIAKMNALPKWVLVTESNDGDYERTIGYARLDRSFHPKYPNMPVYVINEDDQEYDILNALNGTDDD